MKMLVAGTFKYPMYQEALCSGLEQNNVEVHRLVLDEDSPYNVILDYTNTKTLKKAVSEVKPDAVFLYRVENIFPSVLAWIRKHYPSVKILIYHNDDPFGSGWKRYIKSFLYLHCIKYSDITYVYRKVNINEALAWGAKDATLLMSYYNSKTDLSNDVSFNKTSNTIVFVGHYEEDGRAEIINHLFLKGLPLQLYGYGWEKARIKYNWPSNQCHDGVPAKEYKPLIENAAIALAFLSKRNRDEYTRRCFEIPIMGTLIAAERTPVTEELFNDGENAILFSSKEELSEKLKVYTANIDLINIMAKKGHEAILNGGHSEVVRAKMIIDDIKNIK